MSSSSSKDAGGGLTIVDAHHHFRDPDRNYHPWLRDELPIPFRYGDYGALARRYLAAEYLDLFGIDRCMFASNFPVDSLCATFDEIYGGFDVITRDFSEGDRRALFADNARRLNDIR
jgi:predicted TIM-barrel fold metal-dependent hydrolase